MGNCSSKYEKQSDLLLVAETLSDVSEGKAFVESKNRLFMPFTPVAGFDLGWGRKSLKVLTVNAPQDPLLYSMFTSV